MCDRVDRGVLDQILGIRRACDQRAGERAQALELAHDRVRRACHATTMPQPRIVLANYGGGGANGGGGGYGPGTPGAGAMPGGGG